MDAQTMLDHYVTAALWTSTEEDGMPLDYNHDADDIAPETLERMREDVTAFLETISEEGWDVSWWTAEQMGHDFWLTRNGHGAGFWDRGQGAMGDKLTDLSRPYGDFFLYVGDDNRIHGE